MFAEISYAPSPIFWALLSVAAVVYVILTSIYQPRSDEILLAYFMQNYWKSYITKSFGKVRDSKNRTMLQRGGVNNPWNLCFLLYPLYTVIKVPNGLIPLRIHCVHMYTSDGVPIILTVFINLRLTPDLESFVDAFGLIGEGDLTRKEWIEDNLYGTGNHETEDPDDEGKRGPRDHIFPGPHLSAILLGIIEDVVIEVVRTVTHEYPWHGPDTIKGRLREFEQRVMAELAAPESPFSQGGLLRERDYDANGRCIKAVPGPACLSIDFNIRDVIPADPTARQALSEPLKAELRKQAAVHDADAAKTRGIGEGDRIAEKARRANLDPKEVWRGEVAEQIDNITVFAHSLMDGILQGVLGLGKGSGGGKKNKKRKKKNPPNPGNTP